MRAIAHLVGLVVVSILAAGCDLYTWEDPPADCDSGPCCRDGEWLATGQGCLSGTDDLDCTEDVCNDTHACEHPVSQGYCLIGGVCYAHNQDNSEESCKFCDSNVSQTSWQNRLSSTVCDDEDPCTYDDRCTAQGACEGTAISCEDEAGTCGMKRSCDGSDTCVESYPGQETSCDDEEPCTHSDACNGSGICQGISITCTPDSDPCAYQPYCDGSDTCAMGYPGEETNCDDNEACTHTDVCNGSGGCAGTTIQCDDDPGPCGVQRSCDGSDTCAESYPDSETYCDDAEDCTRWDVCDGEGGCAGTVYDCHGHGTCNSDNGFCTCTEAGYTGDYCDECADGYFEYPAESGTCITDPCIPDPCNGHGTCGNATGAAVCTCNDAYIGDYCDEGCSEAAFGTYPDCFIPSRADCATRPCFSVPPTGVSSCYNETSVLNCSDIGGNGPNCGDLSADCTNPDALPDGCFCGQDGQYVDNPRTFTCYDASGTETPCANLTTAQEHETVVDSLTGLVWQRTFFSSFTQTISICASSNDAPGYAGFRDWREPSVHELLSLTEASRHNPVVDVVVFPGGTGSFWSSNTRFDDTSLAWSVHMSYGLVSSGSASTPKDVRCVRGGYPAGEERAGSWLTEHGTPSESTVIDAVSGLEWALTSMSNLTWQASLKYCQDMQYAGYEDWRLPDRHELMSIVDFSTGNPASAISSMVAVGHWSSTSHFSSPANAWYVDFEYGNLLSNAKDQQYYARCVRGFSISSGE